MKKGFTTAEMLIALTAVGVLSAVLLSNVGNRIVDKNKALFMKSFKNAENLASQLANDENLYPYDEKKSRLLNTENIKMPESYCPSDMPECCIDKKPFSHATETKKITINGRTESAEVTKGCQTKELTALTKFCYLLKYNLNTSEASENNPCEFVTTDNVFWKIEVNEVTNASLETVSEEEQEGSQNTRKGHTGFLITIDTDGKDKGINKPAEYIDNISCTDNQNKKENSKEKSRKDNKMQTVKDNYQDNGEYCKSINDNNRDKYFFLVRYDGKLILPANDTKAQKHLRSGNFNRI